MAASQIPFRSISLPARLQPINTTDFESELQKLKSWQKIKACVSKEVHVKSETIQFGLMGLAELYNSVEKLVQSPATQKSPMEESLVLEGSVELIDSCNNIREMFQMIRENVQTLQSALRRKGQDSSIQNDIATYFSFRKKMNNCAVKSIKTLKKLETKINVSSNTSVNANESLITRALREVREVCIVILKCVLLYLSWPMPKSGGWNLVSKLMITKDSGKDHSIVSEVGSVDFALNAIRGKIKVHSATIVDGKMVQRGLQDLDSCIGGLEGGLENLFRQLLRCRVTLLNVLTDQ